MKKKNPNATLVFIAATALSSIALTFLFAAENKKPKKELSLEVERPVFDYKAENLRDPFKGRIIEKPVLKQDLKQETKKYVPPAPPTGISIQGIVWGGRVPYAIVNNKVVKANDMINSDIQVVEINKEGIIVLYKDNRFNFGSPAATNTPSSKQKPSGRNR